MTDVEALLGELIAFPSVNPRGRPEAAETPLARWIAQWASERGMDVHTQEVLDGRLNVVVTLPGTSAEVILLETHLDTVEADAMTVEPFTPTRLDERIYGRGACDAKGPLAVFMAAMDAVRCKGLPHHTVVLAGVVDEEHQYKGVQEFRTLGIKPIGAVIGEPTRLRMVTAHKGCMRCVITASGPGGHSSEPWGRTNPIETIAEVIKYLSTEESARLSADERPLVGPPSLAVTLISGGQGPNVLPDTAAITVDRRTVAGEDPHEVWQALSDDLCSRWPDNLGVAPPHIVDYALQTDPADPFVESFARVLAEHSLEHRPKGVGHGTDASKIALDGIPAVVFGPGSIESAHTPDEFVPIEDLHRAQTVIEALLTTTAEKSG